MGLEPVLTERQLALTSSVRDALAREIAVCDTYVGLFDRRRGTVPVGSAEDDPRSITEEELALARKLGLRCLVFLSDAGRAEREPELNDFLDAEVTEYRAGLWTRFYKDKDEAALRREIAAGLAALRPRVVLELASGVDGLAARLFLRDVAPAWTGKETVLGPVPVRLDLSAGARSVLAAFRRGAEDRGQLKEEAVRLLGQELGASALPAGLGEALAEVLDLAASVGRLVALEVRTTDPAALTLPWELISVPRHPLPVREGLVEIVRRIPAPGELGDPIHETAATVLADHLSVLGFTAAPLEDEAVEARLGTGGFGTVELFWEKEQERLLVALEGPLHERRGQLFLADTGEKEELRERFSRQDRPEVVHIACHSGLLETEEIAERVLLLEDAEGRRVPLRASELLSWVRSSPGGRDLALLFLSSGGGMGRSNLFPEAGVSNLLEGLAEVLVRGGILRVLGMQGTVSDVGATAFAEKFYTHLAAGADLTQALQAGRVELLAKGQAHEWAIPTLTTRCDAGPLVVPEGSASPVEHPFEAVRGAFEAEGISYLGEGYVGRRDAERRLRRAFEAERLIAIHGLGGIGKSTLAARFLERRQAEGWRVLILYAGRELAPATVFEEVAAKLGLARPSGVSSEEAEALLRQAMKQELRTGQVVLFLDNFEDNQDGDGHLKNPALGEALLALALLGGERFRMLFTSRLPVELGNGPIEVSNLDLGELSPSGCRKLRMLDPAGLGQLSSVAWEQVLFHLGGHPKALELFGGFLKGRPDRVRQLLADLGSALGAVEARLRADLQEKGRKLLVQNVLATVPPERRLSFDRLCLLEVPLPTEELEALLTAEGIANPAADLAWLRDHGFLARTVAPSALTGGDAVHRLLASRHQEALAEREGAEAVRAWHLRVADHLVARSGPASDFGIAAWHRDAAGDRAGALGLYNRWAMSLRDRHAYSACLQIAEEGLQRYSASEDEAEQVGAAKLWVRRHDAMNPLGRIEEAESALEIAFGLVAGGASSEASFLRAGIQMLQGRLLQQAGRSQEAMERFEAARVGFEQGNHPQERAVALGDVARLRAQSGDVSGALSLQMERLETNRRLGDVDGIAAAQYDLAVLELKQERPAEALERLAESWDLFCRINRVDFMAVCGALYGQLLATTDPSRALEILRASRDAFQLLGRAAKVKELDELIRKLEQPEPPPAQPRPTLWQKVKRMLARKGVRRPPRRGIGI